MAFLKVKNRAISTLAAGVSDTDTSWTVTTGEGSKFPGSGDFHLTCEDEIVKCTARSGDVLTVTRAQEGTGAASHDAGRSVELRVTAGIIENIQSEHDTHASSADAHHNNANDPSADQKAALAGTSGTPSGTNKYVTDADPRNTDSRSPTTHKTSHQNGGSDEISITGLSGEPSDTINKSLLTTQGDIIVRGAAAPERFAIGSKNRALRANSNGDGLNWVIISPLNLPAEKGLDFFHWTTTLTGSASEVSKNYGILHIETGTTAGSTARSRGYSFGWINWSNLVITWRTNTYFNTPSANARRWLKLDIDAHGDPTGSSIGFRIDGTAIKGFVHNGSALTVVDLNTIYSDSNARFEIIYDGATVYWYVNETLKGQSSNVPSGVRASNHYLVVNVGNISDAIDNDLRVSFHYWAKEVIPQ